MIPDFAFIRLERDGAIARLVLNRPERMNAFTRPMHRELAAALDLLEAEPPHVLILTGAGRGFCAGQDLTERLGALQAGETPELGPSLRQTYNRLIARLEALPSLIIAAVNGPTAGAGIGLALTADLILAARDARFLLAFGKVGLGPDAGVSHNLPRRIGAHRALGLMLTGAPLEAEQAAEWGLVWQVVETEALEGAAMALARQLAAGFGPAQQAAKRLLRRPAATLAEQLEAEAEAQDELGRLDYFREAVLRFSAPKAAPRPASGATS